jgi:hypothetical protein
MSQPFVIAVNDLVRQVNGPAQPLAIRYQTTLLALVGWPNPAGAPQVDLVQAEILQPKALFIVATNTITVQHAAQADPLSILDAILYESSNAMNIAVATASALPKDTAVGNFAAALAAAEFTTLKNYIVDLIAILLPVAGLAGLDAQFVNDQTDLGLPPQAGSSLLQWLNTYLPLYTDAAPILPPGVIPPVPMPPPVPVGQVLGPNGRDVLAERVFTASIHDPHATGANAHLASLTTFQVYYYERVRDFSRGELLGNIAANYPNGSNTAVVYASEWTRASLSKAAKVGLYAGLIANLLRAAAGAGVVPVAIQLPVAVSDYSMNELTAWLNANSSPVVVTGFNRDLVRGLIQDLAPRILQQPWHKRAV